MTAASRFCTMNSLRKYHAMKFRLLANSVEHSLYLEPDNFSANQERSCFLRNAKFQYHFQKSPPLVPILSRISPVHSLPPSLPKIDFSIVLPSILRSSKLYLSFWFYRRKVYSNFLFPHACHTPPHPHLIPLYYIVLMVSANYKSWGSLWIFPQP